MSRYPLAIFRSASACTAAFALTIGGATVALADDETPTPSPTATASPEPTATPEVAPTASDEVITAGTSDETSVATDEPSDEASAEPTAAPTGTTTQCASTPVAADATDEPSDEPTTEATADPTGEPAEAVTASPVSKPTATASPTATDEASPPVTPETVEGPGADDSTTCAAVGSATDKLSWAPPKLDSPTTVTVPDDGNVKLAKGKDYKLVIDGTIHGTLHIQGGDDVVLVGGEVDSGTKRAAYLQGQTGTLHIEGVKFTSAKAHEGIDISEKAPTSTVQLQNINAGGVDGSYDTHHADLVQTWSGPGQLRIDRFDGKTDYQGLFLLPKQHNKELAKASIDLRNVVTRDVGDKSAFHAWLPKSSGSMTVKATAVVAVKPGDDLAHTIKRAPDGVKVAESAKSPLIGEPGTDYTSPGYAQQ